MNALTITVDQQSYPVLELPGRPKAILDWIVAEIFMVETKYINRVVTRNPQRFPKDDACVKSRFLACGAG